ncbi:uncharacterized protein LOC134650760 [Cydia amplana]|uniref:uncharacterized protein LOC134650760 n=1 Tax=Cydia amplana TaxID=1869771 RepID=UPI002FE513C3
MTRRSPVQRLPRRMTRRNRCSDSVRRYPHFGRKMLLYGLPKLKEDIPLDVLATIADRVHEVVVPAVPAPHVAATSSRTTSHTTMTQGSSELERQVAALTQQVATLMAERHTGRRSRSRSTQNWRYRNRSRSRSRSGKQNPDHCWYHNCFGNNAKKCEDPCSYSKGNSNGSR